MVTAHPYGSPGDRLDKEWEMVRVDCARWGQTPEDLRRASLEAPHARSRERFQALYLIASGRFNATARAAHIGRQDETVLGWVHHYNRRGPDAVAYRRTGGRAPLLRRPRSSKSSTRSRARGRPSTG
jgi:hypothetical protein